MRPTTISLCGDPSCAEQLRQVECRACFGTGRVKGEPCQAEGCGKDCLPGHRLVHCVECDKAWRRGAGRY